MISLHVKAHKEGERNTGQGGVGQYVHTREEEQVGPELTLITEEVELNTKEQQTITIKTGSNPKTRTLTFKLETKTER